MISWSFRRGFDAKQSPCGSDIRYSTEIKKQPMHTHVCCCPSQSCNPTRTNYRPAVQPFCPCVYHVVPRFLAVTLTSEFPPWKKKHTPYQSCNSDLSHHLLKHPRDVILARESTLRLLFFPLLGFIDTSLAATPDSREGRRHPRDISYALNATAPVLHREARRLPACETLSANVTVT